MSHTKQVTLQDRHYKNPDDIKLSKNISMTEAQYAELHQAAKKEFMAARVK